VKSTRYVGIAIALSLIGSVTLIVCFGAYWYNLHELGLSPRSDDWGSFGAFISGIAGTTIALTTLIALAATFALQARELESSRHALQRQSL
jgi:hypothetical protein